MAMDPDAEDEIQIFPFGAGREFNGYILNHPPDLTPVVEREFNPEPPVFHLLVPLGLVVSGFLDLVRPVFQAGEIERLVLIPQVNDLHDLLPGPGISALTKSYGRRPIKARFF
jgi:hypothetical protein